MENKNLRRKFFNVLLIVFVVALLGFFLKLNYFNFTLLYFGLPVVYLISQVSKNVRSKVLYVATFLAFPLVIILDYIATINFAWTNSTMFGIKFLSVIPFEDLLWGFLLVCYVLLFYEYFFDSEKTRPPKKRIKHFILLFLFLLSLFLFLTAFEASIFIMPYAYFLMGTLFFLLPVLTFAYLHPQVLSKCAMPILYFFAVFFFQEIIALKLGHWHFDDGEFLGSIQLGSLRFPFEEFIFFFLLFSIAIISYYEFIADDRK